MALLFLAGVAGSVWGSSGTASGGTTSHPQRSVSAPANVLTLADYAVQPDLPEGDEGGEEDSTLIDRDFEPKAGDQRGTTTPTFSTQDTTRQGSGAVISSPFDTLGQAASRPFSGSAATGAPPSGAKSRRGVLGLHPAALLVGLVALHIFVVTVAGK